MENSSRNILYLSGKIVSDIEFSHESHGTLFYTFRLETRRLSGTYDVKEKNKTYNPKSNSDIKKGDLIISIGKNRVNSLNDLVTILKEDYADKESAEITILRDGITYKKNLKLLKDEYGNIKTGLFIKERLLGIGTVTYYDPENKTFGALGHEIIEKTTKSKFDSTSGTIFSSTVTSITKSNNGDPGEKNARSDSSNIYGKVDENTESGIFGTYTKSLPNSKLYKVASPNEIKQGSAKILTVIEGNTVEEFDINIIRINENSNSKNILFEVTDEQLLEKTGGIVQGMSGSPIIQGDNIIGAVNFVLVDSPDKGYGIFITNMLEEAEN